MYRDVALCIFCQMRTRTRCALVFLWFHGWPQRYSRFDILIINFLTKTLISGEQNGYNIPEVTAAPNVSKWLTDEGVKLLSKCKDDKMLPDHAKRLICDGYMCFYQSPQVMMYQWKAKSIFDGIKKPGCDRIKRELRTIKISLFAQSRKKKVLWCPLLKYSIL